MTEEDKWRKTIDSYLTPAELISAMNKMFEYIEQTLNKHEADLEELKLDKRLRQAIREQMQKNIEEEAKEKSDVSLALDNIDEALNEIFGKDASFRSNGKNLFRQRRNQEIRELMEKVKEHDKPVTLKPVRPPTDEERKKHPEWFDE